MGCWKDKVFQLRKQYLKVAGVGKGKTVACLGNYGSLSVAELWMAKKWVVRNEAGELSSHLINYVEEFA